MSVKTIVVKLGGTSVGSPERTKSTGQLVAGLFARHRRLVVAVSAMAGQTD